MSVISVFRQSIKAHDKCTALTTILAEVLCYLGLDYLDQGKNIDINKKQKNLLHNSFSNTGLTRLSAS